eukprot:scaffold15514_cov129-Cylindrotheca_fusiformis.AAC.9
MSTDDSSNPPKATILSSHDFMQFLSKQSISKLTLSATLDSGDKVSASFDDIVSGNNSSVFKSIDLLRSLNSQESVSGSADPATFCEFYKNNSSLSPDSKNGLAPTDLHNDNAKGHVDVSYTSSFKAKSQDTGRINSLRPPAVLPPKKGSFDWQGMFKNALSPLVTAASIVQPQPLAPALGDQKKPPPKNTNAIPKESKRKPRKIIPVNKEYIDEYRDSDILFGRGGRSNHHPGNKIYRDLVTERQPYYRNCDKSEKTKVAQAIVDMVQRDHKGRFLELDKEANRWYIVPNIVARRKVGQALRENNTEEARAAKREKYGQGKVGTAINGS